MNAPIIFMTQTLSLQDWTLLSECAKQIGKDVPLTETGKNATRLGNIIENEVNKEITRLKKKAGITS